MTFQIVQGYAIFVFRFQVLIIFGMQYWTVFCGYSDIQLATETFEYAFGSLLNGVFRYACIFFIEWWGKVQFLPLVEIFSNLLIKKKSKKLNFSQNSNFSNQTDLLTGRKTFQHVVKNDQNLLCMIPGRYEKNILCVYYKITFDLTVINITFHHILLYFMSQQPSNYVTLAPT